MVDDQVLKKKLLLLNVIWFAILISLGVYVFVAKMVAPDIQSGMDEKSMSMLRQVLYGVSVIIFFAPVFLKKLILSAKGAMGDQASNQDRAIQKYFVAGLVSWALSESIGIYGLVLYLLGKNTTDLYLLIGISAAALFVYRPSREALEDYVRSYSHDYKKI